ncbi:MAG: O-methyltransferase [Salinirussus sp.]
MASPLVSDTVDRLARAIGPDPDAILDDMAAYADREEFPIVGPELGGWLAVLARVTDAQRALEFGSGFGYSAYWIARELPADGEVILTEIDADELAQAREYFERSGLDDRARFQHGDALELVHAIDGPLDLVLLDHGMERYVEAFEAVRAKVPTGGVIAADNAVEAGEYIDPEALAALVDGEDRPTASEDTRGTAAYLRHVRDDPDFASGLVPLGEGLAVSFRTD